MKPYITLCKQCKVSGLFFFKKRSGIQILLDKQMMGLLGSQILPVPVLVGTLAYGVVHDPIWFHHLLAYC